MNHNKKRWISFPIKFMTLELADILSIAKYTVIKISDYSCIIRKED